MVGLYAGVSQLARESGSYPECHWFESDRRYHMNLRDSRESRSFFVRLASKTFCRPAGSGAARHHPGGDRKGAIRRGSGGRLRPDRVWRRHSEQWLPQGYRPNGRRVGFPAAASSDASRQSRLHPLSRICRAAAKIGENALYYSDLI